ncbi:BGTF surface domain-containing protein [Halobaculum lipolyticum]|uniref:BGTF surface domain-containing protein n=1 Tax=Halobaculum lipolyticum TaxID=3032001 RepID=A0ABD5WCG7_9EURY|nr:BGTF surface domain-containing protein [Halobaculum sp. DT31]
MATFTVRLNDSGGSATVVVGNESETGYQANVSVTDADADGVVTFAFNTYAAGTAAGDDVVWLVGDSRSDRLAFDDTESQTELDSLLDAGDYLVSVGTTDDPAAVLDSPAFVGALFVTEREDPSQSLWRTTRDTLSDVREAGDNETRSAATAVGTAVVNERLTRTETLAFTPGDSNSDVLVVRLTVPGLSGVLGPAADADVTDEFAAALTTNATGETPLRIALAEATPGQNRDPVSVDIGEALSAGSGIEDALTVVSVGGDTYYVFVDYDAVAAGAFDGANTSFEDGDEIAVNSSLQDARLLDVDTNETAAAEGSSEYPTASTEFTLEAAEGGFDLTEDDLVATAVSENATVTGTTNVAPGTTFSVVVRSSEEAQSSFFESRTVVVASDGTFAASFDLSAGSPGDAFEVRVSRAPFSAAADGVLIEGNATGAAGAGLSSVP